MLLVALILYTTVFTFVEAQPNLFEQHPAQTAAGIGLLATFILFYTMSSQLSNNQRSHMMTAFACIGVVLSILMTWAHFNSTSAFCPPTLEGVPCDIVNQSIYSEIAGIPVAALGILGYLIMAYLAVAQTKKGSLKDPMYLHLITLGAFAFTIWLNYVQFAILMTLCLFCEMSAVTVVSLVLLSYQNWRDE